MPLSSAGIVGGQTVDSSHVYQFFQALTGVMADQAFTLANTLTVTDTLTASSNMNVTGSATVSSNVNAQKVTSSQLMQASSNLAVGLLMSAQSIQATSSATVGGNLTVTGTLTGSSNANITGTLTVGTFSPSALTVTGAVNAATVTSSQVMTASSNLSVTGSATVSSAVNAQTITSSQTMTASSNMAVGNSLEVGGATQVGTGTVNVSSGYYKSGTPLAYSVLELGQNISVGISSTVYWSVGGNGAANGTESLRQNVMPKPTTLRNLVIELDSSTSTGGTLVFTTRKNGISSSQVVTFPGGSTAGTLVSDTVNTVAFSSGDLLSFQIANNTGAAISGGGIGGIGFTLDL